MRKVFCNIMCGCLILCAVALVTWVLNHFFGAFVAGIYAAITSVSIIVTLYEIHTAPIMEDEDLQSENQ